MPNLSIFDAKLAKINGNESLQNISGPQYTFISHRPLNTGFKHNFIDVKVQSGSGLVLNACYRYAVVQYNLLQWGR
jgi:hypothetical protein